MPPEARRVGHRAPDPRAATIGTPALLALDDASLIGRGSGRACHVHPHDPGLCVKVPYNERGRKECRREWLYLRRVERRYGAVVHAHAARLHGPVPTDRGEGWVAERVRDAFSGETSAPLTRALTRASFDAARERWREAFEALVAWTRHSGVVVRDWSATNLCAQRLADGRRRLVVIDGIGPKTAWALRFPRRAHARERNRRYAAQRGVDSVESLLALCERER